jgi:hypothetical protein
VAHPSNLANRLLIAIMATSLVAGCAAESARPVTSAPDGATPPAAAPTSQSAPPTPDQIVVASPRVEAAPLPEAAATPKTSAAPLRKFSMDLFERGDFVAQYTFEWCVGASLQMALLLTDRSHDRSRGHQRELWRMARDASSSPFGGANPIGWTAALNRLGIGPYTLVSRPTLVDAVRTAALAIRATKRPVGLVMWRGRHAWLMSGFESRGDPRKSADFTVTRVHVLDPLYPHGSKTWGPSARPDAAIGLDTLGKQFVPRLYGRVDYGVAPGYVLVLPTA